MSVLIRVFLLWIVFMFTILLQLHGLICKTQAGLQLSLMDIFGRMGQKPTYEKILKIDLMMTINGNQSISKVVKIHPEEVFKFHGNLLFVVVKIIYSKPQKSTLGAHPKKSNMLSK